MSPTTPPLTPTADRTIAFVGGGNMASAILGGLRRSGLPAERLIVVEPFAPQRERLRADFGIEAQEAPDERLTRANIVVWATKPQTFQEAATSSAAHTRQALHLSVMAGIRSDAIARAIGTERIVRAMPNTPALIGLGMSGLFARDAVTAGERATVETLLEPTGQLLWVDREVDLDAVTALSGSGPAYVFYFVEAMVRAAEGMGLSAAQGKQLALATFAGATELARRSDDPPAVLRERVTSKGGTTYAALTHLEQCQVGNHFVEALEAARERARTLGDEFGG